MPGMAGVANSRRRADVNPRRPTSLPYGSQLFLEAACRFPSTAIYNLAATLSRQSLY
ncbi:hypothetical protein COCCADRAFT_112948 [Bipolaris zeicola 26-R-13]|uniref:Uncharacterized protein n=1 Tax=Cochliobolus carbonum (strain 26-R-13) TaxID=930089 RepID=W6XN70_COCC2|nr:uncharacterized protein COCCADRAFT_112948 [Bipolaris zeicola 26-R-13]EUC26948.1 hypothetical protein COCCADRAFT_112948 [Bipolaris zeicola 26-R-13]